MNLTMVCHIHHIIYFLNLGCFSRYKPTVISSSAFFLFNFTISFAIVQYTRQILLWNSSNVKLVSNIESGFLYKILYPLACKLLYIHLSSLLSQLASLFKNGVILLPFVTFFRCYCPRRLYHNSFNRSFLGLLFFLICTTVMRKNIRVHILNAFLRLFCVSLISYIYWISFSIILHIYLIWEISLVKFFLVLFNILFLFIWNTMRTI